MIPKYSLGRAALVVGLALSLYGPALAQTPAPAPAAGAAEEDLLNRTGKTIKLRKFEQDETSQNEQMLALAEQKRMESIERLKGLLSKGVADETKAEMMLRLADLYF